MSKRHEGDIKGSHPRKLRDPEYNSKLAAYLRDLDLSGEQTMIWILDQLYEVHTGRLRNGLGLDEKIKEIKPDGSQAWLFAQDVAEEFGEDPRRWINDYKAFAIEPSKQRLHVRLIRRVMFIECAILIDMALNGKERYSLGE